LTLFEFGHLHLIDLQDASSPQHLRLHPAKIREDNVFDGRIHRQIGSSSRSQGR